MATNSAPPSVSVPTPSVDLRAVDFATDPIVVGRWSMYKAATTVSDSVVVDAAGRGIIRIAKDHPHLPVLRAAVLALPQLVEALEMLDDLCPRMNCDDPVAPAVADALRLARAALATIHRARRGEG